MLLNANAGFPIVEWYDTSAPDIADAERNKPESQALRHSHRNYREETKTDGKQKDLGGEGER